MKTVLCLLSLLFSFQTLAAPAGETVQVVQVLKGDTVIVAKKGKLFSTGASAFYVHLVGVAAPNPDQPYFTQSKAFLENLVLNQRAYLVVLSQQETHIIGRLYLGEGGIGPDLSAKILSDGWGFYRDTDEKLLGSLQRGTFNTLADQAKYKKKGIWADGQLNYTITADADRKLENWKNSQSYFNGVPSPQDVDNNRPAPSKRPNDWRTVGSEH